MERLPDKAFRNRLNRREKSCKRCRRNQKARERYHEQREEFNQKAVEADLKAGRAAFQQTIRTSNASLLIRELRKVAAQDKHYARKYKEKMDNGTATARTYEAYEQRQKRVDFYNKVESLIMEDERRRVFHPLSYYLSNTKLLAAMGFPTRVRRGDPDLLLETNPNDTREEGQERDSQDSERT